MVLMQRFHGSGTCWAVTGVHPRVLAPVPACTRPKANSTVTGAHGAARRSCKPLGAQKNDTPATTRAALEPVLEPKWLFEIKLSVSHDSYQTKLSGGRGTENKTTKKTTQILFRCLPPCPWSRFWLISQLSQGHPRPSPPFPKALERSS